MFFGNDILQSEVELTLPCHKKVKLFDSFDIDTQS